MKVYAVIIDKVDKGEGFYCLIVYRMGRLCGGAHEVSSIKAPLFLCGGWLEGSWGGWVGGWW